MAEVNINPCVRCREYVAPGKASHCLCVEHDPKAGWIWCSKACMLYSHKAPRAGQPTAAGSPKEN